MSNLERGIDIAPVTGGAGCGAGPPVLDESKMARLRLKDGRPVVYYNHDKFQATLSNKRKQTDWGYKKVFVLTTNEHGKTTYELVDPKEVLWE